MSLCSETELVVAVVQNLYMVSDSGIVERTIANANAMLLTILRPFCPVPSSLRL